MNHSILRSQRLPTLRSPRLSSVLDFSPTVGAPQSVLLCFLVDVSCGCAPAPPWRHRQVCMMLNYSGVVTHLEALPRNPYAPYMCGNVREEWDMVAACAFQCWCVLTET